jgi:hypothetical protein
MEMLIKLFPIKLKVMKHLFPHCRTCRPARCILLKRDIGLSSDLIYNFKIFLEEYARSAVTSPIVKPVAVCLISGLNSGESLLFPALILTAAIILVLTPAQKWAFNNRCSLLLPYFAPSYALNVVVLNPVESIEKSVSIPATGKADKYTNWCKMVLYLDY